MGQMKKIAIIGTAGIPARYGGFETLVHQLVNQWNGKYDVTVYCSKTYYKKQERVKDWNGAKLCYLPFNANGIQSIIYDIVSIFHALFFADVLLILGVSGGIVLPLVKLFTNKKIIVNIDGLEWRRPKWNKWVQKFLKFSEYLAVKYSDIDITDNAALKRYTAINYGTLSYLIAYGADHVQPREIDAKDLGKYCFLTQKYAFKVCRIEPENNLHVILSAFQNNYFLPLVIVGNWNNSEYGIELRNKYSEYNHIHLLDPVYDQSELDMLRSNCDLYIHGHSAGGTNPSLVEAMYLKLPVIAFNVVYNVATMKGKGMYFENEEQLECLLKKFTKEELQQNAKEMFEVASESYTWEVIANRYHMLVLSLFNSYSKQNVESNWSLFTNGELKDMELFHMRNTRKFYNENI